MKQPESNTKSLKVPQVLLKWENPKTGLVCGYERARQLGLTKEAEGKLQNPKTGKLVGYYRAVQLGLLKKAAA